MRPDGHGQRVAAHGDAIDGLEEERRHGHIRWRWQRWIDWVRIGVHGSPAPCDVPRKMPGPPGPVHPWSIVVGSRRTLRNEMRCGGYGWRPGYSTTPGAGK